MRAHLATCSHGYLGLITSDAPVAHPYSGNYLDLAWTGIHLTAIRDKKIGDRWMSKAPRVICPLSHPEIARIILLCSSDERWGFYPGDFTDIKTYNLTEHSIEVLQYNADVYQCNSQKQWSQTAGTAAG